MNSKNIKFLILLLAVIFILSAIPYFKPDEISLDNQKKIEVDLNNLTKTSDRVTLIDTPQDAFDVRMAMIQGAKEKIDISSYIIHKGESTNQIFAELIKATQRGVKVRVIVDGKLGGLNNHFGKALSQVPGIEVYLYNPFSLFKIGSWQTFHHEKHMSVDGKHLLLGGRNFGDKYFMEENSSITTVNDYDVFVTGGDAARDMHAYVDSFITHEETKRLESKLKNKHKNILDNLHSISNSDYDLSKYVDRAHAIEAFRVMKNNVGVKDTAPKIAYALNYLSDQVIHEMYLQTPYLSAHPRTLKKFEATKNRRVEVTLLTNSIASSSNYPAFSNYYKNKDKFIETGINIYEYQSEGKHSQHGKAYIFDDMLAIGSVNLDDRSFFINTESMIFLKSEGLKQEMLKSLGDKIEKSYHVSGDGIDGGYREPFPVSKTKRFLMYVASIFSRLFSFLV